MMKKVIVISAHPDDEIIGVGGTLLKHKAKGDELSWIIVTTMIEGQYASKERIETRRKEIEAVTLQVGFSHVFQLNYPTACLTDEDLLKMIPEIASAFNRAQPEIVYCLNRSDAHSDHRIVFDAVMACTKSFRSPFIKQVLMYECLSETEFAPALPEKAFIPNYYVDISEFFKRKLEVVNLYKSEIGEHPFPRSSRNLEALAVFRGSSVGVEYAEAFQAIKIIDK